MDYTMTTVPKIEIHNSSLSNVVIALLAMITIVFLAFFAQKAWVDSNANQTQAGSTQKAPAPSVPDFVINAEINTDTKK
jgi:flagellar basal body-associated protein FliL